MRIEEYLQSEKPTFETRLLYAQLVSPYDCNCDSKWGYLAGAGECLESYKPISELKGYIDKFVEISESLDEYDKAYVQAYKDYIKQEQSEGVTNE